MIRKIITIESDKCNGCGACVSACHEGAIGMENGKAVLLRDDYCDGLGDCLPVCPTGAITFEEREALPYDEAAVLSNMRRNQSLGSGCACPGAQARELPVSSGCPGTRARMLPLSAAPQAPGAPVAGGTSASQLRQWPVQIKLVPVNAPYFMDADLLIAADCTAFAHGSFNQTFMAGKVTLIGCPKLDDGNYSEKLTAILARNHIRSITVTRMSVPCCGGIEQAVNIAVTQSGKDIPVRVVTISPEGEIFG